MVRDAKEAARAAIESNRDALVALSHAIHGDPELGFEEHRSVERLAQMLRTGGLEPVVGHLAMDTALSCEIGTGGPTIAICAEYDALPQIGHACGHNVIAAIAVGATLALSDVADIVPLRVRLLGTPAEEVGDGAGKVLLLERGAFEGVDAALMVHPAPFDIARPNMIAGASIDVEYHGKASHAAFYPELGINAADALTIAQVAIGLLRQHILPGDRIHGITTRGGDAPNIVPAETAARYLVRSREVTDLEPLLRRVRRCFEAGALGTGAELTLTGGSRPYAQVVHDPTLSDLYVRHASSLGRSFESADDERPSGSTDMGNVSQVVPAIHPLIGIGSWPAVNHQPEFAAHAVTASADQAIVDGAIAIAWTAIDFARANPQPRRARLE